MNVRFRRNIAKRDIWRGVGYALDQAEQKFKRQKEIWREDDERRDALHTLHQCTYALQHSPHCPSPFLVRMCGDSMVLDYKPYDETKDVLGFGKSFGEAAIHALAEHKKRYPHR